MPKQKGFTLIEILVAVTIIAILGVIAIPNYHAFQKKQLVLNSAKGLAATLKLAQSNASTGTKCPDPSYTAPKDWDVVYGTNSYYLRASCYNPNGTYNLSLNGGAGSAGNWIQINIPNTTVNYPSGVTASFSSNNQWNTNALNFQPGGQVNNDGGFPWPIQITITDGTTTQIVQVDYAGNITVK